MKKITLGLFVGIAAVILFSTAHAAESEADRLSRMLSAFDRPNIERGALLVSFTSGTTKGIAEDVLESFGLAIKKSNVCVSSVNPGEQPTPPTCSFVYDWSDSTRVAKVGVTEGSERKVAEELYAHERIEWVEPSYIATVTGDSEVPIEEDAPIIVRMEDTMNNVPSLEDANQSNSSVVSIALLALVVVAAIAFFALRGKRT